MASRWRPHHPTPGRHLRFVSPLSLQRHRLQLLSQVEQHGALSSIQRMMRPNPRGSARMTLLTSRAVTRPRPRSTKDPRMEVESEAEPLLQPLRDEQERPGVPSPMRSIRRCSVGPTAMAVRSCSWVYHHVGRRLMSGTCYPGRPNDTCCPDPPRRVLNRWTLGRCVRSWANATVPPEFVKELARNAKAKQFYATLNNTNLYSIAYRLQTAKRPETKTKRTVDYRHARARREISLTSEVRQVTRGKRTTGFADADHQRDERAKPATRPQYGALSAIDSQNRLVNSLSALLVSLISASNFVKASRRPCRSF